MEATAGQRVRSEGTLEVNAESTAHGHQEAEDTFQRHDINVQHSHPACLLSLPGVRGTGAAVPLLD